MKHSRWIVPLFALGGLSLEQCDGSYRSYPCGASMTVCVRVEEIAVTERSWSFEGTCVGSSCAVQSAAGGVSIGESFHPSDQALHIAAGGVARLPLRSLGSPDGAKLSLNARCDDGASLWLDGDSARAGVSAETSRLAGPGPWRRVDRTVRSPLNRFDTIRAAQQGETEFAPQLRVEGSGSCVVDRMRYTLTALVCTAHEVQSERCYEWMSTPRDDAGAQE